MLEFQTLSYNNRNTVNEFFAKDNFARFNSASDVTCDLVFGTTFLWREYYSTSYAEASGSLILQIRNGGISMFSVPIGEGDIKSSLVTLKDYAHNNGIALYFCFVPEAYLPFFHDAFDIVFASEEPDWSDYVYDLTSLRDFLGRRYHGQKNHLNKFKKMNPNASFHTLTSDNVHMVKEFASKWYDMYSDNSHMSEAEERAVFDYLNNLEHNSNLTGGVIMSENSAAGFTVGEIVGDTVFIHIEKADHTIPGAYQFLQSEFLRSISNKNVKFVNREEDMGIPGLRKAKHALHPVKLLKKYTLYCC